MRNVINLHSQYGCIGQLVLCIDKSDRLALDLITETIFLILSYWAKQMHIRLPRYALQCLR